MDGTVVPLNKKIAADESLENGVAVFDPGNFRGDLRVPPFDGLHRPPLWWQNVHGDGSAWTRHVLSREISGHFDNMRVHDFHGDGRDDLVIEGYGRKGAVYFRPSPQDPTKICVYYAIDRQAPFARNAAPLQAQGQTRKRP